MPRGGGRVFVAPADAKRTIAIPYPTVAVRPLWSQTVASSLRGLSAARERGWFLVWDNHHNLFLFNQAGERQAQAQTPADLVAAGAADDGRSFVAIGAQGQVYLLAPDLTPRWQ